VSIGRVVQAERILLMAVPRLWSKSTNVSAGHNLFGSLRRDDFTGTIQQHYQKVEGLGLQAYLMAVAAQLTGVEVRSKTTRKG